jgi:hypothetical protein
MARRLLGRGRQGSRTSDEAEEALREMPFLQALRVLVPGAVVVSVVLGFFRLVAEYWLDDEDRHEGTDHNAS